MNRTGDILLSVEGLHVAYGKAEVVHGVSFDVRAGEFAVLLGRNGAGKSTILHAVSGLIPKLGGTFDFVFVDAWKPDYKRFLDLVLPRLVPRGLFLAHNVLNKQNEMREFLAAIKNDPRLFTAIVAPSGEGMSVSYKRR